MSGFNFGIKDAYRKRTISYIRKEAARRINRLFPEWKQRNMLARSSELIEKRLDGIQYDATDQAEYLAIKSAWSKIKLIREYSNSLEGRVLADEVFDISSGWPE